MNMIKCLFTAVVVCGLQRNLLLQNHNHYTLPRICVYTCTPVYSVAQEREKSVCSAGDG